MNNTIGYAESSRTRKYQCSNKHQQVARSIRYLPLIVFAIQVNFVLKTFKTMRLFIDYTKFNAITNKMRIRFR